MMNIKKLVAIFCIIFISILSLNISKPAMAASRDFYDTSKYPIKIYANADYMCNSDILNELISAVDDHPSCFVYEFGGQLFNCSVLINNYKYALESGLSPKDAFRNAINTSTVIPAPVH